jgi:hypothetical protein
MTSEKKSFLLAQLQKAIDEAISESPRIGDVIDEMKRCGYDLCLMLESTVTIAPSQDHPFDALPEPRLASNVPAPGDEIKLTVDEMKLTERDLEFLQELNIAA